TRCPRWRSPRWAACGRPGSAGKGARWASRSSRTSATSPGVADPGVAELVLVGVAVLVGAGTQRLTGLGLALVSAPFLVLLLGPFTGVLLANALSLATNVVVLGQTWRAVEVRKALLLAVPAVAAVVPGAW